jgi:prepilin-type N-terminal cleavage/methylation domain-containing protein
MNDSSLEPIMTTTPSRRAFSLIELLIVILIIALVIAIVLPALSHTRKAARNAATRNLMTQIQQACSSFELSERKLPGYFTAKDMGDNGNLNRGFTWMENVMFDLAGGLVPPGSPASAGWACGPVATRLELYNPDLVGVVKAGSKAYFTPPAKYYKFQNGVDGGTKNAVIEHQNYIRDIVDAEGTPILYWGIDPMAIQPITQVSDFANESSGNPSRFYWAGNAAFLSSTSCGDKRTNQSQDSLIGGGNAAAVGSVPAHAAGLLTIAGNPNSPVNLTPPAGQQMLPSSPRGQFVIQAAGSDAIFVANQNATGAGDRGGKIVGSWLDYRFNYQSQPSKDIMSDFDDLIVAGG